MINDTPGLDLDAPIPYQIIAWESYDPRYQMTTPTAYHGVPEAVKARKYFKGKTFCGKTIKARGQHSGGAITCKSCVRSAAFKAFVRALSYPFEPSESTLWGGNCGLTQDEVGF